MIEFLILRAVIIMLFLALGCAVFSISHFLEKVNTFAENYEEDAGGK